MNDNLIDLSEIKDPELLAIIERLGAKILADDIETDAKETAGSIKKEVAPDGNLPPQQMWMPFCPMPTDMCRVSPFFPMARQELGKRKFIEDMVITSSSWGEIKYTGPQLSTYEEDVLMAVLALLDSAKNRQVTEVEGKSTYTYKGPLLPILRLMGYKEVGSTNYKHVLAALKLMTATNIEITVYKKTSTGKRKTAIVMGKNIITAYNWNDEKKELSVTVNPYFYESYIAGSITLIDVLKRTTLNSPIAKTLHRFMKSHRDDVWQGHFMTLAAALNLDMDLPAFKLRERIRSAINELVGKEFLLPNSGFLKDNNDVVKLIRRLDQAKKNPACIDR